MGGSADYLFNLSHCKSLLHLFVPTWISKKVFCKDKQTTKTLQNVLGGGTHMQLLLFYYLFMEARAS